MAQSSTEQVALETLDRRSSRLGEIPGRAFEPRELVEREPEPKYDRRG